MGILDKYNLRLFFIMQELVMHECAQDSITGFVGIIDMDNMGLKHAALYTPSLGMKGKVFRGHS